MADIGFGCVIKRSDDGTATGNMIDAGFAYDFTPPASTAAQVETTNHQSAGRSAEYISGKLDHGSVTIDTDFEPGSANVAAWYADLKAKPPGYYQIVFNDDPSTTWGFFGNVESITPVAPLETKRMLTVEIKVTGYPGWVSTA